MVLDEQGEPIIGANIVEKGTTNGTITDIDGNYTLTLNDLKKAVLQFSFIGWAILSALTLGIGYLWLTPYTQCSIIAFYKNLSNKNVEPEATETQI